MEKFVESAAACVFGGLVGAAAASRCQPCVTSYFKGGVES